MRITNCILITVDKAKLLGNTLIDNQFKYVPLIWTFCQKTLYLKIEKIHKTLRIIHQSNTSHRDFRECNGSTSIHQRRLQILLSEIYRGLNFPWISFCSLCHPFLTSVPICWGLTVNWLEVKWGIAGHWHQGWNSIALAILQHVEFKNFFFHQTWWPTCIYLSCNSVLLWWR